MKQLTFKQWLNYLENLHQKQIDLGLTRIKQVAAELNLPRLANYIVMVAGTNGKGSTVHTISQLALAHDINVAQYTSPHLFCFRERLLFNNQKSNENNWCRVFAAVEQARGQISLSFFEFTTLAAFLLIAELQPELAVIEVGLGGRLDACNIVDADCAIITSIDYDHQAYLGDDLASIAREKCGIMRKDQLVINGEQAIAEVIIAEAARKGANLYHYREKLLTNAQKDGNKDANIAKSNGLLAKNIQLATMCLQYSPYKHRLKTEIINNCCANIQLTGRQEFWQGAPNIVWDVAHNIAAVTNLAKTINNMPKPSRTLAVFSCLNDKPATKLLAPFKTLVDEWFFYPLSSTRAMSVIELRKVFSEVINVAYNEYASAASLWHDLLSKSSEHDLVVVFGSFFVIAELQNIAKE